MAIGRMLAVRGDRRGVRGRFPSLFLFKALHAVGLAVSRALGSRPPEFVRGAFAGVEPV